MTWIRRYPLKVLRPRHLGLAVECAFILACLTSYALVGHYAHLFEQLARPFETFANTFSVSFGIILWSIAYLVASGANCCERFEDPYGDLATKGKQKDRRAYHSAGHMIYHLLRWPLLLGMAASRNLVVIIIAYWIDAIVVAVILLSIGIVCACEHCARSVRKDIQELLLEDQPV